MYIINYLPSWCSSVTGRTEHAIAPTPILLSVLKSTYLVIGLSKYLLVLASRPYFSVLQVLLLLLLQLLLLLLLGSTSASTSTATTTTSSTTSSMVDIFQLSLHTSPFLTLFCVLGGWPGWTTLVDSLALWLLIGFTHGAVGWRQEGERGFKAGIFPPSSLPAKSPWFGCFS